MYARFFRWASDRLSENGVLAFVTNRSFIESRTFDGFRKTVVQEFSDIYIVDLGGDVRANPKLSGTKHNVFGIQTGVAISFMVKRVSGGRTAADRGARVFYVRRPEMETAEEKLSFLANNLARSLSFDEVQPDRAHNWINLTSNDFDALIPLASKETKAAKTAAKERAIFKLYSLGVVTARDEWVYDDDPQTLGEKVGHLINTYNANRQKLAVARNSKMLAEMLDESIKWSRAVKKDLINNVEYSFDCKKITASLYRLFVKRSLYFYKHLNEMASFNSPYFNAIYCGHFIRTIPCIIHVFISTGKNFERII